MDDAIAAVSTYEDFVRFDNSVLTVMNMGYGPQVRRFRGSKRRVQRIHFSARDKWMAVAIAFLTLLAMTAGAWLGFHYED